MKNKLLLIIILLCITLQAWAQNQPNLQNNTKKDKKRELKKEGKNKDLPLSNFPSINDDVLELPKNLNDLSQISTEIEKAIKELKNNKQIIANEIKQQLPEIEKQLHEGLIMVDDLVKVLMPKLDELLDTQTKK